MRRVPSLKPYRTGRKAVLGLGLGLVVALVLGLARSSAVLEGMELRLVDVRTEHHAAERRPDERIVVMQIEDGDIQDIQRDLGTSWPWPLSYNAAIAGLLEDAGAAVLVVDILHLDRGAGPDDVLRRPGKAAPEPHVLEGGAQEAEEYAAVLRRFGGVALAMELSARAPAEPPARIQAAAERLGPAELKAHPESLSRARAHLPVRRIAEAAAVLGFSNAQAGIDGVVREAALLGHWGERSVLSLPLAAAQVLTGDVQREDGGLRIGDARQALMPGDRMLVNHGAVAHAKLAPAQVLAWALEKNNSQDGAVPAAARDALAGKIVIFGINSAGLKDVIPAPIGAIDGPAWQATVLDNLLHGDGRVRASRVANAMLLALLCIVAGLLGTLMPTRWLPHLVPLALGAALVVGTWTAFGAGTSYDVVTPLLGLLLVWGGTFALRALTEGRRNRWLEGAFGRYMSPSLIAALKRDPALLELGGRTRTISILFSDIAGFTRISEKLGARDVVRLLNRYLTDHCAAVMDEDGIVDKFEGDAVMAFFGDPVEQADHALRACRAALRVQAQLPRLQPLLQELGLEELQVRVGVNSGEAVVGNMGSTQRFDYTCIGDSVNLASRIEGAAKAFGVGVLVGAATAEAVGEGMLVKPLGAVVVIGRAEPVAVFELVAESTHAGKALREHVASFARAVEAARAGEIDAARAALADAERSRPGDGPCVWLAAVLDGLDGAPWDGVTVLDRK